MTPTEQAAIDGLAEREKRVAADTEAQRAAAELAEDLRVLVAYMIADGAVEELERLAERFNPVSMADAIRLARARRTK